MSPMVGIGLCRGRHRAQVILVVYRMHVKCGSTGIPRMLGCRVFADDSSAPPCFGDYFIFPTAVDELQNDTM